ncbi:MAG: hypothetical protein ABIQ64_01935 [Candidatus Saccharimonadales bacterium]
MSILPAIVFAVPFVVVASFLLVVVRGAPYIPSHKKQVRRAFSELYNLKDSDRVLDLGSGTGTVLQVAREYGALALGYELNPVLWAGSKAALQNDTRIVIELKDYNRVAKLPKDITIVYAFTTSRSINTIGKKLEQWSTHQDLYFISYGFTIDGREADKTVGPMHLYHFPKKA